MPSTYTLISSNVLSTTAASVTFSAIPSTYTDLVLRVTGRSAGSSLRDMYLQVNSITSNYSGTRLRGYDSTPSSSNNTASSNWFYGVVPGTLISANTFSSIEYYLPNYTSSANKVAAMALGAPNDSGSNQIDAVSANLLSNTAAISSLTLTESSGSGFVSGSSFYLYGIKNS
jgi:hypothetical protein